MTINDRTNMQYWECFCYDATFNVLAFLWRTKAVINNSQGGTFTKGCFLGTVKNYLSCEKG